jgi:DNA invertase Pin-like site-specific DNA recombinase
MVRKSTTPTQVQAVVGYVRVSIDEQSLSVEAQCATLTAWCQARRLTLVAIYEDVHVSGGARLEQRSGLLQALDALTAGAILLATKRDRLARDAMAAAMIERLAERVGATVQTCDGVGEGGTPEAKLMRGMIDLFAEYERQVIQARIKTALGHKKAKQERVSGRVPYGKQLAVDSVHLEDNPAEQAVIVVARELHAEGLSSRSIAGCLAERGLYSRAGTPFSPSAILSMVAA